MKRHDAAKAVQIINNFSYSRAISETRIENILINPIIGDLKIDDKNIMPARIL